MSAPFIAEVRMWACNFAPRGWATCDGQLQSISQNTALFALIGTIYGGDGRVTFGLPNFKGNIPVGVGQGPGLSPYDPGQIGGEPTVTLQKTELPNHDHSIMTSNQPGEDPTPKNETLARSVGASLYQTTTNQNIVPLASQAVQPMGKPGPHNNMQPYLPLVFCIALTGIFPPRS